ncbi:MAG: TonB-dependent receptor [Bacteroidota bacterium]
MKRPIFCWEESVSEEGFIHCKRISTKMNHLRILALPVALLFLFYPLFLSAQSDRINLDVKQEKRANILLDLAVDYDYEIVFNDSYFDDELISIRCRNQSLAQVLERLLKGTRVDFKMEGRTIRLFRNKRIYGYIIDQQTGEKLINAIFYDPQKGQGRYTNDYGFFSVDLPYETTIAIASYIGYHRKEVALKNINEQLVSIELKPILDLAEIVVLKDQQSEAINVSTDGDELLSNEIKTHFASGGEADIFQYLYQKTGVTKGPDGLGGLHVRGGKSDQNLILYDGVKVYNPSHSLGLFSIFNSNLLQHARFSKYNFNPRFGGNLSSVLDLRLKEGNLRHWGGNLSFSTLASQLTLDGPLVKDKTGLLLSFRRTHLDPYFKQQTRANKATFDERGFSNHYFYDVNAKLHHRLGQHDRLFFSFYQGRDAYHDETDFFFDEDDLYIDYISNYDMDWGNRLASFRWNHLFGNNMFSNLTLSYSDFDYRSITFSEYTYIDDLFAELDYQQILTSFYSNISEWGLDYDIDFFPSSRHHMIFGAGFRRVNYAPGVGQLVAEDFQDISFEDEFYESNFEENVNNAYHSDALHVYANDTWHLGERSKIQAGLRYTYFISSDRTNISDGRYPVMQSRLAYQYRLSPSVGLSLALGRTWQPLHLLNSAADVGFPNDLWVPSTARVRPQRSDQINLNLTMARKDGWSLNTSVYYKAMKHLLRYAVGGTLPSLYEYASEAWEDQVISGSGRSYGFETELGYRKANFRGNMAYTLARTDREFPELNEGFAFPFQFDQRHSLALNLVQKLGENYWLYANWQLSNGIQQTLYRTNAPYTPLETFSTPPEDQLSELNAYALPVYHRLDLGLTCTFQQNNWEHEFVLGVQNVYNRRNIYYTYFFEDEFFPEDSELVHRRSLPILPTLRYQLSFRVGKKD